jgi:thiol-disulfide isomerase/thioredoxin
MRDEDPMDSPAPTRRWTARRIGREVVETLVIIAVVVGLMTLWQRADQRGDGGSLPAGLPAPAFALVEMGSGERVTSEDLLGRPTVLNFWATWCGPCRAELPDLAQIHAHSGDRYRLLTITKEPSTIVLPFLEHRRLTLPVLYDPGGRVSAAYGVDSIPMTVILDAEGRVVHDFVGSAYPDILVERLERLITSGASE